MDYYNYLAEIEPEDPAKKLQMKKISEYLEWYLTRNETSFFFNEMELQTEFFYMGHRYVNLAFDLSIEICTYPERQLLLRINQNDECDIIFSFDGRLLGILTSREGIVCYDIEANQQESKHPGSFSTFCFGKKSVLLAGAYKAGYIFDIWNKDQQAYSQVVLQDVTKTIQMMCFSNNDLWICIAREDGTIDVWSLISENPELHKQFFSNIVKIHSLCFSNDDKMIAFGTSDLSVTTWHFEEEGNKVQKLRGHKKSVTKLLFTPDGTKMISLDGMAYMMIWNLADKMPLTRLILTNHVEISSAIIIDNELITLGRDFSFGRWDLHTGRNLVDDEIAYGQIDGEFCNGNEVAFSIDGTLSAKVNTQPDIVVNIWDTKSGNPIKQIADLPDDLGYIKDLTFSFDKKTLAICYQYLLYIYNVENCLEPLHRSLKTNEENPEMCAYTILRFSRNGILACGTDKGVVCIWEGVEKENTEGEEKLKPQILKEQEGLITALEFDPKGEFLATADSVGTIRLWDIKNKTAIGEMDKHESPISWLVFYEDMSKMLSSGEDRQIIVWELKTHTFVYSFKSVMCSSCPMKMALNSLENKLIVGYNKGELEIFSLDHKKAASIYFITYHNFPILNVRFLENDRLVLSQSAESSKIIKMRSVGSPFYLDINKPVMITSDGKKVISIAENVVEIWNTNPGEKIKDLTGKKPVIFCEVSSDDQNLVISYEDGSLSIWDLIKGRLLIEEIRMSEKIKCAKFHKEKLILGSLMGAIYVLGLRLDAMPCSYEILKSIQGHTKEINCMDVDFSGVLATGGKDLKICLWFVSSMDKLTEITEGIKDEVKTLIFSEEGSYIYAAIKSSQDEEIKKWEVNSGELTSNIQKGIIWKGSRGFCINRNGKRVMTFMNVKKDKWRLEVLDENLSLRSAIRISLPHLEERYPNKIMISKTGDLFCFFNQQLIVYWDLYSDEEIFMKTFVRISTNVENPDRLRLKEKKKVFSMDDLGRVYPFIYNILHTMAYTDDYKGRFSDIVATLKAMDQTMDINGFFEEDIHHRTPFQILLMKKNRKLLQEYLQYFMETYQPDEAYKAGFFKFLTVTQFNELFSIFYGQSEFISKILDYCFYTPLEFPPRYFCREFSKGEFITSTEPVVTKQKLEKTIEEKNMKSTQSQAFELVKAKCLYVPSLLDNNNKETNAFYLKICKLKANDILFTNDTLLKIITHKWQQYGKKAFLKEAAYLIFFMAIYIFNCSYMLPLQVEESNLGVPFRYAIYQQICVLLNCITYILLFIYMKEEINQIRVFGVRTYFSSIWNCFDVPLIIMLIAVNFYSFMNMFGIAKNQDLTQILHSICIFFFFIRLLSFARGFQGTGFMVRLVIECVYDIKYFLVLMFLFIFCLAFSSNLFNIIINILSNYLNFLVLNFLGLVIKCMLNKKHSVCHILMFSMPSFPKCWEI